MHKAVILGSNYYIGLSLIRCLGSKGVYTVAMDYCKKGTYGAASKYLNEQLIVPHYREGNLLDYLLAYGKNQEKKPVLFPSADAYVEFIDQNLDVLKSYYLIPMNEKGLWSDIMDKSLLHQLAYRYRVLVPETYHVEDYPELIDFPVLLKPTDSPSFVSFYRKKMFVCQDQEDLCRRIEQTKVDGFEMIIQRIIPGGDDSVYTYDAYLNQDSQVTHETTCHKIRQFPVRFGASAYTEHLVVEELFDIGRSFLEKIKYKGFAEIEFKKDSNTGLFYLIEVNVRTTTLNVLLDKVGINFPYIQYQEMVGKEISSMSVMKTTDHAFRYHLEDYLSSKQYIKEGVLTRAPYKKSLKKHIIYAIWDKEDVKPYLEFWYYKLFMK